MKEGIILAGVFIIGMGIIIWLGRKAMKEVNGVNKKHKLKGMELLKAKMRRVGV